VELRAKTLEVNSIIFQMSFLISLKGLIQFTIFLHLYPRVPKATTSLLYIYLLFIVL
jgi:hypothetical protein